MIAQGVSGTVTWTLDDEGTLCFIPVDGKEGTFADSIGYIGCELEHYNGYDWNQHYKKIKRIKSHGLIHLAENSSCMFFGCSYLTDIDLNSFDTSKTTTMIGMFENCSSLRNLNLCNFDTSHVTNMAEMFSGCCSLRNLDITSFNTSKVLTMYGMFEGCSSLENLDLNNFDTRQVTSLYGMFAYCSLLQNLDLSSFDTSNVNTMSYMFYGCSSLKSIDSFKDWNTKNVTNMSWMFYKCVSLKDIETLKNWNIQRIRDMSFMFYSCSSLKDFDLSHFTVSKNTCVIGMFWDCDSLTTVKLSNINRNIVLGFPTNETSTFSSKWHKVSTIQEYDPYEIVDNWNSNFEGIWSRKKVSKSIPTDELKITTVEGKIITVSLKDKILALKLGNYSVRISYK